MKLSVACNFDPRLVDTIRNYPVYEVYGKLTSDVIGGGRPSFALPSVNRRNVAEYVDRVHAANIEFKYLINAACSANVEYTRTGQRRIRSLLDWLADIGVDSVTTNHPMLLKTVKEHYQFKCRVGIFASVNSPQRAKQWESEGADSICLEDISCNRDFKLLAKIRKTVNCELQLLVNNICSHSCFMAETHKNMAVHASQRGDRNKGFYVDYCTIRCTTERIRNPVQFIRSTWIRPEDLAEYEKIGFDTFKIVDRSSSTETLHSRVAAYSQRSFDGNLLNLICSSSRKKTSLTKYLGYVRYFCRLFTIHPAKLKKLRTIGRLHAQLTDVSDSCPVQIMNKDLDGFLEPFKNTSCCEMDCSVCCHCHEVAERYVVVDEEYRAECISLGDQLIKEMEDGALWQ